MTTVTRPLSPAAPVAGGGEAQRVSTPAWRALGYAALAALAYVPVVRAHPGKVAADTKQYLYLAPARVLERAWSMWDPNIGLGTVTHQNIGYLFPMGPYYWLLDRLGVADWLAQRLWLGTILFAAGVGMLYLFRTLGRRGPGVVVGALAFMLTPYLLDYSARISVILLPWAGLPWLLAFVIRALRDESPGIARWRYPALFAIVVQVVGGVNATALVFAAIAPVLWIPYSIWVVRESTARRAGAVVARIVLLTGLASLWWIAGLWAQGAYGLDILRFTETVRAVSRTSIAPEVLRGLGYWFFYGQDKIGSWTESSVPYTQATWLILVSFSIPALALLAAAVVRWRYRAYFALITLVGLAIAVGTYPYDHPSPAGALFKAFANGSTAGLALRSTGRATPLVVLGLAALLAAGVDAAVARLVGRGHRVVAVGVVLLVAALVVANLPSLWRGTFYGGNLERAEEIPQYWKDAIGALDRRPHDTRILEVPGADFASYRWGNTVDPITPGLTDRPYVARELIPWGSPASANLLNAFDRRMQEGVLDPGAIAPVARLMSAGDVVVRNDLQTDRYNLVRPRSLWHLFNPTPSGLGAPTTFGTTIPGSPKYPQTDEQALAFPPGDASPAPVAVYPVEGAPAIVRAASPERPLIVSGDGEGIVDLASVGLLPGNERGVLYSASFADEPQALRTQIGRDATLAITDTNRAQARRWSTVRDNLGATEQAGERPLVEDQSDARLDMFPGAGPDAFTTVEQRGVSSVQATSYGNPVSYTPEDRAARALDGDVFTAWKVGAFGDVRGQRLRIVLARPVTTDHVDLVQPLNGPRDRWITGVDLRFDGSSTVSSGLGSASRVASGQEVRFPRRTFTTLDIEITASNIGVLRDYQGRSAVGFAEVRLRDDRPGSTDVTVDEVVKMPTDLLKAAGADSLSHPLVYTMTRDRTIPVPPRYDPELDLVREFSVRTGRSFALTGTARLNSVVADDALDRLLGIPGVDAGGVTATSSQHLPGSIVARASSAIDGDPTTAWQTQFVDPQGQKIRLELPAPVTFDHLDLAVFADGRHSVPTSLTIASDDGTVREVAVPPIADGAGENATATVPLRFAPITGRTLTVTLAGVRGEKVLEYFGGGMIDAPVAIAELGIPGVVRATAPPELTRACRSDLLTIDGNAVAVRVTGSGDTAARLGGLALEACDGAVTLQAGRHTLRTVSGGVSGIDFDRVVLSSAAGGAATGPAALEGPVGRPAVPRVRVTAHTRDSATVHVEGATAPFWLVLGQSNNAGWRATANGKELGASTLVDGYANGWIVPASRGTAITLHLRWTPQRVVDVALVVSAVAFVIALAVVGWTSMRPRRRRRRQARGSQAAHPVVVGAEGLGVGRAGTPALVGIPLVAAVGAGLLVQPWAAPLVGGATLAALLWPRARVAFRAFPPVAVALCGLYVAVQQYRHGYPPKFEWATAFARIHQVAWLAVVVLAADALIDMWSERAASRPVSPPPAE